MAFTKKFAMATTVLVALTGLAQAQVADDSKLKTVLDRGSLLCSGHNGSFLGFAEVDDQGVCGWIAGRFGSTFRVATSAAAINRNWLRHLHSGLHFA